MSTTKLIKNRDEMQEKFNPKREKAMKVEESFVRLEMYERAERLHNCSAWLKFAECPNRDGFRKLIGASFCRDRLCPMCNWRRSKMHAGQILKMLHVAQERRPKMKYIFLTLTVRNVTEDKLSAELDRIYEGYRLMFDKLVINRSILGWIRNLEITYNAGEDTYHPHFHVLIGVSAEYFTNDYISQSLCTHMWGHFCKLDYTPVVHIQRVKPKREDQTCEAAVLETAKYSVKDSDYIKQDEYQTDKLVEVFARVLHGRRLIGFGKLFKKIRAELKQQDLNRDDADLVGADGQGCQCPICSSTLIETLYSWDFISRLFREKK